MPLLSVEVFLVNSKNQNVQPLEDWANLKQILVAVEVSPASEKPESFSYFDVLPKKKRWWAPPKKSEAFCFLSRKQEGQIEIAPAVFILTFHNF